MWDGRKYSLVVHSLLKGCTHRATESLQQRMMSQYRCIERVNCSVGTLVCCDRSHSSKLSSTERTSINHQLVSHILGWFIFTTTQLIYADFHPFALHSKLYLMNMSRIKSLPTIKGGQFSTCA